MKSTGYEIYSQSQLRDWMKRALAAGDTQFAAICKQTIENKKQGSVEGE